MIAGVTLDSFRRRGNALREGLKVTDGIPSIERLGVVFRLREFLLFQLV
jgi:hypothetical protein